MHSCGIEHMCDWGMSERVLNGTTFSAWCLSGHAHEQSISTQCSATRAITHSDWSAIPERLALGRVQNDAVESRLRIMTLSRR